MRGDLLAAFSQGTTVCHRLPPRLKVLLTLAVIAAGILIPPASWPLLGCLGCVIFAGLSLAEIPLGYLGHRLLWFVPLVLMTALAAPLSRGFSGGWDLAGTICVRATVAFLAALWLVSTTPLDRLLNALCGLGMPRLFAELLSFTHRYIYVLFDELARMKTAQRARTFQPPSRWRAWTGTTHLVGMLFLRALQRSERIHGAMLSRGWQGRWRTLD